MQFFLDQHGKKRLTDNTSDASETCESSHHWTDDVASVSDSLHEQEGAKEEENDVFASTDASYMKKNLMMAINEHHQATARGTRD